MLQFLQDERERGSFLNLQIPGLLHDLVDLRWAALGCLHSVSLLDMLHDVRQRLNIKEQERV